MPKRMVKGWRSAKLKKKFKGITEMVEPLAEKRGRRRKYGPDVLTDNELVEKARLKADRRSDLIKKDRPMWRELRRRELLHTAFGHGRPKYRIKSRKSISKSIKKITENVELLKKQGKLNQMLENLSEFDRKFLTLIMQDPRMTEKTLAKKLGVSMASISNHKRIILSQLRDELPPRIHKKYENLSDDEIRKMIKDMGVGTINQINDSALIHEIYYRKKHFKTDFSDVFKRDRTLLETDVHISVNELLEKGKNLNVILMWFSETERKVLENVMSENSKYPQCLGIKTSGYNTILKRLRRYFSVLEKRRNVVHDIWARDDYLEIIERANLTDNEKHVMIHRQFRYPPLTLQELADELRVTRARIGQIEEDVKIKLKIALEGNEVKRKRCKYRYLSDGDLIEKARETADSRGELADKDMTMWKELKRREGNLFSEAYGPKKHTGTKRKYEHFSDGELVEKANEIADGRRELQKKDQIMYRELKRREGDLLFEAYGPPKNR